MPRYRKLHVKATESLDINEMPDDFTRLLWVMLPLALDREGRGLDNAAWVKAKLMPLREDVTGSMIEAGLVWWAAHGMIERYVVNGRRYLCVPHDKWAHYQGDTSRESESEYPTPPEPVTTSSRPTHEEVVSGSGSYSDSDSDPNTDTDTDSDRDAAAVPPKAASDSQAAPLFVSTLEDNSRRTVDECESLELEECIERWSHALRDGRAMESNKTQVFNVWGGYPRLCAAELVQLVNAKGAVVQTMLRDGKVQKPMAYLFKAVRAGLEQMLGPPERETPNVERLK